MKKKKQWFPLAYLTAMLLMPILPLSSQVVSSGSLPVSENISQTSTPQTSASTAFDSQAFATLASATQTFGSQTASTQTASTQTLAEFLTAPSLPASTAGKMASTHPDKKTAPTAGKKKSGWWESLLIIIYADAVMSVENVLIIAILVSEIPGRIRMVAVFVGLLAAGIFRVVLASMATILMRFPVVALLGAITLIFLAISLFTDTIKQLRKPHKGEHSEEKIDWKTVKEELSRMFSEKGFWKSQEGESLKTVISAVILQDILLSLDNVLVVAGTARGDIPLTLVGVFISVVMMGTVANLMISLVKKYPVLGFIGGLALAKAAYNLYIEAYSHEAAVIAFGSIVVFIMFGRVYKKLTSEEADEVKPLSFSTTKESPEGKPVEAIPGDVSEEPVPVLPTTTGDYVPNEVIQELLAHLKRNGNALNRIELLLAGSSPNRF